MYIYIYIYASIYPWIYVYIYICIYNLGKFHHDLTLFSRALGIMVNAIGKSSPFYGRTLQVSELLLLAGFPGTWMDFIFPFSWECDDFNWRFHIFLQRGWNSTTDQITTSGWSRVSLGQEMSRDGYPQSHRDRLMRYHEISWKYREISWKYPEIS